MSRIEQLDAFLGEIDSRSRDRLAGYLETVNSPTPEYPGPIFVMPRSEELDHLLCQLAARADWRCATSVLAALERLHSDKLPPPIAATGSWPRELARTVHLLDGLEDRLSGYVATYLKMMVAEGPPHPTPGRRAEDRAAAPAVQTDAPSPATQEQHDLQELVQRLRHEVAVLRRGAVVDPGSGLLNRSFFLRRLAEEASRAGREQAPFSVVLCDCIDAANGKKDEGIAAGAQVIASGLRGYDLCCHTAPAELAVLLPGASTAGCASIVSRIRQRVAGSWPDRPLYCGTATWQADGHSTGELLRHAIDRCIQDYRRQKDGVVAMDDVPASMVEEPPPDPGTATTIWLQGINQPVQVQAVPSPGGLRMRLPLTFLRTGSAVRFDRGDGILDYGTLAATVVGGSCESGCPVLQLEVSLPQRR